MTVRRVAIAGASGLIGTALAEHLRARGDEVVRLVRRPPRAADEAQWDPGSDHAPLEVLRRCTAVVNLAGAGIGDRRWTPQYKRELEQSRTDATGTLANALAQIHDDDGTTVRWVNGSAVGYYGDRGEQELTEKATSGTDFLAGLTRHWEAATAPASQRGVPVAFARTGLVMARGGGAFAPLVRLTRLGLFGPLAGGREWWPWITLADEVAALAFLVDHPAITGPVNVCAPGVARQRDVATAMGRAFRRPAILPAPAFALRIVLGEFADAVVASQRVVPDRLVTHGFTFTHPRLEDAVTWLARA